ncbi:Radical SAM domain protein [Pelobacter propionicus DSM 2379]|uniref:Radical SAM domain protein n=1 Tax=Pelobacter propionicus (strain DSM 2379 / NBRC 103807 / OttBd1) TaxID=338966 RepID=A1AUB4_PELPD|nr:Radical SAM domain protein [Pelobacter propionicus DSM 2379]
MAYWPVFAQAWRHDTVTDKKLKGISLSNDKTYERQRLADKVPLATPYSMDIAPTTFCNLKCIFCAHSSDYPEYRKIFGKTLNTELALKAVDDIRKFPDKLKALHFCGLGEPLIHKDIAKMIKYAKEADISEKIDISTNGVLLTKNVADDLIDSGVDFIRISLNGLSREDFLEYTGTEVDFEKYVKNLKYLYENRKKTKIYLKIFDFMVSSPQKKKMFFRTFEPICDVISIEYYNECFLGTKGRDRLKSTNLNHRGENSSTAKCCSQPFFRLLILVDGEVAPCAEPRFPFSCGNIRDTSVVDIWNGDILTNFRLRMLDGMKQVNEVCASCLSVKINCYSDDNIDSEVDRLKNYYIREVSK